MDSNEGQAVPNGRRRIGDHFGGITEMIPCESRSTPEETECQVSIFAHHSM
jgi:hypothetical protein